MRALQVRGNNALYLLHRTRFVIHGIGVGANIFGANALVVSHTLRVGTHKHIIPLNLMIIKRKVDFSMKSCGEVVDAIITTLQA